MVAILLAPGDGGIGADTLRLLLVMGLLEQVAADARLTAAAMFAALRWRTVTLPPGIELLPFVRKSILARRPGVTDLYTVREEWNRYELGEIAHIENVLRGELKKSLLEKTDEQETTVTDDTSVTKTAEQDTQTTDRFELKASSQIDTSLALHVEGKVDTSGVYGPTKVNSHVGGTFDYSVQDAEARATTQARETVSRATSSVEESVRQQRVARTLTRTRTKDTHALDNTHGPDNIAGVYRWVDKIQTVQVFKYPHRMLYEVEVPEPGAFIRWLNKQPRTGSLTPITPFTLDGKEDGKPLIPTMLITEATAGNEINYLDLASRYDVSGLDTPPVGMLVQETIVLDTPDPQGGANAPPVFKADKFVTIPDRYQGTALKVFVTASNNGPRTGWAEFSVGTDFPSEDANDANPANLWRFQDGTNSEFRAVKDMAFRIPVTGKVPITVVTNDLLGMAAVVEVVCAPTANAVLDWQQKVFAVILARYLAEQQQREDADARAAIQTGIVISGDSAARNAEVLREELKRCTIELLSGATFDGRPAMAVAVNGNFERMNLNDVRSNGQEIQFIEEVFEWENLSYVLYPYFWAAVDKWKVLEPIGGPDAEFDRFLRAGSARVVVPARPGYEWAAELYTIFGILWGGGPAPAPAEELYLSIADEIRAQQQPPADGAPGESWEVRLPTTLVYLERVAPTFPVKNGGAKLPAKVAAAPAPPAPETPTARLARSPKRPARPPKRPAHSPKKQAANRG